MPNLKPELLRAGVFYFSGGLQARLVRVIRKTGLAATFSFPVRDYRTIFFGRPFTSWLLNSPAGDIHQRGNR